jgi:hypothetical protein
MTRPPLNFTSDEAAAVAVALAVAVAGPKTLGEAGAQRPGQDRRRDMVRRATVHLEPVTGRPDVGRDCDAPVQLRELAIEA